MVMVHEGTYASSPYTITMTKNHDSYLGERESGEPITLKNNELILVAYSGRNSAEFRAGRNRVALEVRSGTFAGKVLSINSIQY